MSGPLPVPRRRLDVAWRGGIDLNPLDVADVESMRWLRTLVWPEQNERRERFDAAVAIARTDPPRLVAGDLLDLVEGEVVEAGKHGTVIVFHSAVIAYLDEADRRSFAHLMQRLVAAGACHWVPNEAEDVLPEVTSTAAGRGRSEERFVLGVDGRAVAWTQGHGRSLTWMD